MMRILAVDPGLDAVGLAVFELGPRRGPWISATDREKARALAWRGVIKTVPADSLPVRCGVIASEIRHLALERHVRLALVERPAIAGTYRERGRRARGESGQMVAASMLGFHAACGAVYAGLSLAQVPVIERGAAALPKPQKRLYVNRWLEAVGLAIATNQDIVDAVFVGLSSPWDVPASPLEAA